MILIAGAGPVGLTAALELTRRGLKCRLFEAARVREPLSRAIGINARSLELLEASGVTERILDAANPVQGIEIYIDGKRLLEIDITAVDHRYNFMAALPQAETEAILAERLAELGVEVERDRELKSFSQDGAHVLVEIEGETELFQADYLLGADGAHSRVRKTLKLGFPGETEEKVWHLVDATLDWPHDRDHAVMHGRDHDVLGAIPFGEDRWRFASNRENPLGLLPQGSKVKEIFWQSDFRISYRQVERYQVGRVFLAGDAAHIHSPVGGRGMNLGIEDAAVFAKLAAENRLGLYHELRHGAGRRVVKTTELQTRMIAGETWPLRVLRNVIFPLLFKIPAARRRFAHMMMGLGTPSGV